MTDDAFGGREPIPHDGKGQRRWVVGLEDLARFSIDRDERIYLDGVPILHELKLNREQRLAVWITAVSAALVALHEVVDLASRVAC